MMLLNTEPKSTNRMCTYVCEELMCPRMKCSLMLNALSTDLFARMMVEHLRGWVGGGANIAPEISDLLYGIVRSS